MTRDNQRRPGRRDAPGAHRRTRSLVLRTATVLAAGALLTAPLIAPPVAAQQVQQQQGTVTVDDILDNPTQYYGRRVTITGDVGEVLGPRSFTVSDEDPVLNESIPIVGARALTNSQGQTLDLNQLTGQQVRVTGTVHQFNAIAFEDRVGVDLDDNAWAEYAGQPAIIASSVVPVQPRTADEPGPVARPVPGATATQRGQNQEAENQQGNVTIEDLTYGDAARYYGQRVTVTGGVGSVLGPRSFTITDDDVFFGGGVPVIARQQITDQNGRRADLNQWTDREVRITGTVHQFNLRAFEDQLGVDLDDNAWAEYAGRPAVIASSVAPVMSGQQQQNEQQGQNQQRGTVAVDAILDRPNQYYGRQVTVNGDVNVLGPGAIRIIGEDSFAPETLLVVSRDQSATRNLTDGNNVRAIGTIRRFVLAEIERDFGVDWDDSLFAEFEGRPALVARSIMPIEGEFGSIDAPNVNVPNVNVPNVGAPDVGVPSVDTETAQRRATVDAILDNPSQYYRQRVTVSGTLGEVLGSRSFTVADDDLLFGEEIRVVARQQITDQNGRRVDLNQWTDREVQVTGTVHQFNLRAFEDQLGVDLDDNAWAEYAGRPAIIAESVTQVMRQGTDGQSQNQGNQGGQSGQGNRPRG